MRYFRSDWGFVSAGSKKLALHEIHAADAGVKSKLERRGGPWGRVQERERGRERGREREREKTDRQTERERSRDRVGERQRDRMRERVRDE